jgi:hypothetical protein
MSRSEQPTGDLEADAGTATEGWTIDRERHVSEWAALVRTEPRG